MLKSDSGECFICTWACSRKQFTELFCFYCQIFSEIPLCITQCANTLQ